MTYATKADALGIKRRTQPLKLPEMTATLLVAEMSGRAAFRIQKAGADIDERLTIMVADMLVDEDGGRLFTVQEAAAFIDRLRVDSTTALLKACTAMQFPDGEPGNSKPSQMT